jgi:Fur family peroxide stress response transcriptional regulator
MRYSRKRELIMGAVVADGQHPTADKIYKAVRQENPSISLGTVYRNLNQLAEAGDLLRIPMHGGKDRFDHNTGIHFHLQCMSCGALEDVSQEVAADIMSLLERIRSRTGMTVAPERMQFQGICRKCAARERQTAVQEN